MTVSPLDYPTINGGVVTEAHARYCREHGHATHTQDGVVQPHCPRCGDVVAKPSKLTAAMERNLVVVAEQGSTILWGRDKASALALEKRGLIKVIHCVRAGGVNGDHNKDGLRVEIKDEGYALAVELV